VGPGHSELKTESLVIMNYKDLCSALQSAAGLRLRLRLQPLYGQGEIVFPCTVAGGKYQSSKRRIPGYPESVDCTILDSVQSQANRMEDSLLADIRAGNIFLPHVITDFSTVEGLEKPIGSITCLEAPHRIFDAIIRDSVDAQGKHFPFTAEGEAAIKANSRNASALFAISPASLLFGSWDSTGVTGGLGEKYTRCVVSELVAVNTERGERAGTRVDPLNIAAAEDPAKILKETKDEIWDRIAKNRKKFEKPSRLNHSSVIWPEDSKPVHGGVTCDYIQQSTTISLPALRQLGFPVGDHERSLAAQTVLAAIALHAVALNVERGWHLRSRCDLTLEGAQGPTWEIVGSTSESIALPSATTRQLLKESIEAAKSVGLAWRDDPIRLTPSAALAKLVVASQKSHSTNPTED
jgi:CRISPR-associated protein Csb1